MTPEQRQAAADRYVEGMQQGINRAVEEARAEVKDLKDALKDALGRFHTQGKAKDVVTTLLAGAREEVTRLAAELTAARAELSEARRPVTLSGGFAERDEALEALERGQAEYRDRLQTEEAHSRALLVELSRVRSALVIARSGEDTWQAEAKALANQRDEARDEAAKWKEAVARGNRYLVSHVNRCKELQNTFRGALDERDEARAEVASLKAGLQALMEIKL